MENIPNLTKRVKSRPVKKNGRSPSNPLLLEPSELNLGLETSDDVVFELVDFIEFYSTNPSEYTNLPISSLFHHDWIKFGVSCLLSKAVEIPCSNLFQLTLDFCSNNISTEEISCYLDYAILQCGSFALTEDIQEHIPFIKLILTRFSSKFQCIPSDLLFVWLVHINEDLCLEAWRVILDHCPQLRNPKFLNSKVTIPDELFDALPYVESYMNGDNGYIDGEFQDVFNVAGNGNDYSNDGNLDTPLTPLTNPIIFIGRRKEPVVSFIVFERLFNLLQLVTENYNIDISPLYAHIDPPISSKIFLPKLEELPFFLNRLFEENLAYHVNNQENTLWILHFWKDYYLGDSISFTIYQNYLFQFALDLDPINFDNFVAILQYFKNDYNSYFSSLSPELIKKLFKSMIRSIIHCIESDRSHRLAKGFEIFFSLPQVQDKIKIYSPYYFIRKALPLLKSAATNVLLKIGGFTMEQVWSDGLEEKKIYQLEDLVFDRIRGALNHSPLSHQSLRDDFEEFLNWISSQPGTRQQFLKMIGFDQKKCDIISARGLNQGEIKNIDGKHSSTKIDAPIVFSPKPRPLRFIDSSHSRQNQNSGSNQVTQNHNSDFDSNQVTQTDISDFGLNLGLISYLDHLESTQTDLSRFGFGSTPGFGSNQGFFGYIDGPQSRWIDDPYDDDLDVDYPNPSFSRPQPQGFINSSDAADRPIGCPYRIQHNATLDPRHKLPKSMELLISFILFGFSTNLLVKSPPIQIIEPFGMENDNITIVSWIQSIIFHYLTIEKCINTTFSFKTLMCNSTLSPMPDPSPIYSTLSQPHPINLAECRSISDKTSLGLCQIPTLISRKHSYAHIVLEDIILGAIEVLLA